MYQSHVLWCQGLYRAGRFFVVAFIGIDQAHAAGKYGNTGASRLHLDHQKKGREHFYGSLVSSSRFHFLLTCILFWWGNRLCFVATVVGRSQLV